MMIRLEAKGKKERTLGKTITQKLIEAHLVSGRIEPGSEIGIRIDQTLTQDATGTMAYLQFEAMGIDRVRTELSVSYIDHNTIQIGFENADDHRYLQSVARRIRHLPLAGRKRHLPPGPPGTLRQARQRPCSARTATPPPAAPSACSPSARAASTWRWPWPASRSTCTCPKVIRINLDGETLPLGLGQGRHPEGLGDLHDQGQRGRHLRIRRRGPGKL